MQGVLQGAHYYEYVVLYVGCRMLSPKDYGEIIVVDFLLFSVSSYGVGVLTGVWAVGLIRAHSLGQVAQLVEQWTENPRVGSSILPLATTSVSCLRLWVL